MTKKHTFTFLSYNKNPEKTFFIESAGPNNKRALMILKNKDLSKCARYNRGDEILSSSGYFLLRGNTAFDSSEKYYSDLRKKKSTVIKEFREYIENNF